MGEVNNPDTRQVLGGLYDKLGRCHPKLERGQAFRRLHDNLSCAPHDAVKCFVSLDDHRAILAEVAELKDSLEETAIALAGCYIESSSADSDPRIVRARSLLAKAEGRQT